MEIIIDKKSGFCFGVERAIRIAEEEAKVSGKLYCLGDIVHNSEEINRLRSRGIEFITRNEFIKLSDCKVLIRAHGEPPDTYEFAKKNKIELIDATCPVVLRLQEKIKKVQQMKSDAQIVIFGRQDHPEVVGLKGQVKGAIIIESVIEVSVIDTTKPVYLFAQTTKDKAEYANIKAEISKRLKKAGLSENDLIITNTICGQVVNRASWLADFTRTVDAVIFVGGKSSSNSRVLFDIINKINPNAHFVTTEVDVDDINFGKIEKVGVCGATSTPYWLIEEVANRLGALNESKV
jgi:4-hydroxy-3-methylbut-2-enyl diphosphate reductase